MKKILIINPNSSDQMTKDIKDTIEKIDNYNYAIDVINISEAPNVLESFEQYTTAASELIKKIKHFQDSKKFNYDGILLACVGDPGLYGLKEICKVPVVGVAEGAISHALLLGYKFSILASSSKAKPMMESMVMGYGLMERLASVETLDVPIEAFMTNHDILREGLKNKANLAKEKGAEVLILGCAGMTLLGEELNSLVDMPVIDPVISGLELLKSIINSGYNTSKVGLYL